MFKVNLYNEEKNYSISLVRFLAFCFIFSCHILQFFGSELAWWFNVGVQIFLLISGYLYSKKEIKDFIAFYIKEFFKISVKYYIVIFFFCMVGTIATSKFVDLEIFFGALLFYKWLPGGSHLWFVPTILLCYFLVPIFQMVLKKDNSDLKFWFSSIILTIFIVIYFKLFQTFFNYLSILTFYLGYWIGTLRKRNSKSFHIVSILILFLSLLNILQIYVDYFSDIVLDGVISKLYNFLCGINHISLGYSIFYLFMIIFTKINFRKFHFYIFLNLMDKCTYSFYLVHQFYIFGPLGILTLTSFSVVNIVLCLILTIFTSAFVILMSLCIDLTYKHLKTYFSNNFKI